MHSVLERVQPNKPLERYSAGSRKPHVEAGVVYAVRPDRLLVFVPEYRVRGGVLLTGRDGAPLPPATAADDAAEEAAGSGGKRGGASVSARKLRLETGADHAAGAGVVQIE